MVASWVVCHRISFKWPLGSWIWIEIANRMQNCIWNLNACSPHLVTDCTHETILHFCNKLCHSIGYGHLWLWEITVFWSLLLYCSLLTGESDSSGAGVKEWQSILSLHDRFLGFVSGLDCARWQRCASSKALGTFHKKQHPATCADVSWMLESQARLRFVEWLNDSCNCWFYSSAVCQRFRRCNSEHIWNLLLAVKI